MAPTGVAAINFESAAIHSTLKIPTGCLRNSLPPLTDKMKYSFRNTLSNLKIIIIDEISMA